MWLSSMLLDWTPEGGDLLDELSASSNGCVKAIFSLSGQRRRVT